MLGSIFWPIHSFLAEVSGSLHGSAADVLGSLVGPPTPGVAAVVVDQLG